MVVADTFQTKRGRETPSRLRSTSSGYPSRLAPSTTARVPSIAHGLVHAHRLPHMHFLRSLRGGMSSLCQSRAAKVTDGAEEAPRGRYTSHIAH